MIYTLVSIDLNKETEFAMNQTKLSKIIYINSFFNFKLNVLKNVWKKIINYLNFHYSSDIKDGIYVDFLKFLILR